MTLSTNRCGKQAATFSARVVVLTACLVAFTATGVSALSIIPNFIGGTPSANTIGGGDLVIVFGAAVKLWETAFPENHTLFLDFGWQLSGTGGTGGEHLLISQGGTPNRETHGEIHFNNGNPPHNPWFLDPTPFVQEEFTTYTEFSWDFGTGSLNTGRLYEVRPFPCCDVFWVDLFSVAVHEIGHALGMSLANSSFIADAADGDIDITSPALPFTGFSIPLDTNNAGITSHFFASSDNIPYLTAINDSVMSGGPSFFSRELPSALDVLALAQLSGYTRVNLTPAVPEPSTILLMTMGAGLYLTRRTRRRVSCKRRP